MKIVLRERYLSAQVKRDLNVKMVFVGGARQVGKTTLARQLLKDPSGYLSWDIPAHREKILKRELPAAPLLAFDEIHKYRAWRNYLKGLYDALARKKKILVTGSARLDFYRYGGDSLQGRYHYLRLHPFSAAELGLKTPEEFRLLLELGGFPEPFLRGSQVFARRWSREYRTRLVREELASLERVSDLGSIELLVLRLPELVGSPLSINSLRENLQLSHKTVAKWLEMLERLYAIFRLAPFGAPKVRAVKKERKHYHLDWTVVQDPALRFENLVAAHLLKWVHFEEDSKGRDLELRYFRDVTGREVDFVVTEGRKPFLLAECKWDDAEMSRSLVYLKERFPACEAFQISAAGKKDFETPSGIRVTNALTLLKRLV